MSIEICLVIDEGGAMVVKMGEMGTTEPTEAEMGGGEMETSSDAGEGGNDVPVKSLQEALAVIGKMAEQAIGSAGGGEDAAMQASFRPMGGR